MRLLKTEEEKKLIDAVVNVLAVFDVICRRVEGISADLDYACEQIDLSDDAWMESVSTLKTFCNWDDRTNDEVEQQE